MTTSRISLCIGISNYLDNSLEDLPNACNDAMAMHQALLARGFEGDFVKDITDAELDDALDRLRVRVSRAAEADGAFSVIYFAGHGLEVNGAGFILLADFPSSPTLSTVAQRGTAIARLIDAVANCPGPKLVIIDACRLPVDSYEPAQLSSFIDAINHAKKEYPGSTTADDVLIAFSTSAGMAAGDGIDSNSRYCKALSTGILDHNLQVEELFARVAQIVIRDSTMGQRPWYLSALTQNVSFTDLATYRPSVFETFIVQHDSLSRVFSLSNGTFAYHSGRRLIIARGVERRISRTFETAIRTIFASGANLYILTEDGALRIIRDGQDEVVIETEITDAYGIAASPHEGIIAIYGSHGYSIMRDDGDQFAIIVEEDSLSGDIYSAVVIDDDTLVLCGDRRLIRHFSGLSSHNGTLRIRDLDSGGIENVYDLEAVRECQRLIAVGSGGRAAFFDLQTLCRVGEICVADSARNRASDYGRLRETFFEDAAMLCLNDRRAFEHHFHDQEDVLEAAMLATTSQDLICCSLLKDRRVLAVGSTEGFVFLIDMRDQHLFRVLDVGGSLGKHLQWMCSDTAENALVTVLTDGTMIRHDGFSPIF